MNMTRLLAEVQSDFITTFFPILRYVLFFIILAASVTIIVAIMMQKESAGGTDILTGKQESYYSQNKGGSREGRITRLIYICVGLLVVLSILFFVTFNIYDGEYI